MGVAFLHIPISASVCGAALLGGVNVALSITALEHGDEGVYDAVATDSAGVAVSVPAWLVVLARCPSDFTGDARVDTNDLIPFLAAFGTGGSSVAAYDLNGDGSVNTPDLVRFLGDFGRSGECP